MVTILGIILIILAAVLFVAKYFIKTKSGNPMKVPIPITITMVVVGIFFTAIFYAEPGIAYKVYFPFGGSKIVTTTGYTTDWWGQKRPFQQEVVLKYVLTDSTGTMPDLPDNIYAEKAHEYEFQDAIHASIGTTVVIAINPYDSAFSPMVDKTQSEVSLVHSRIFSNLNDAIINTCKLMGAQDYISGEATNFSRYIKDQLEYGKYELEEYYSQDNIEIIGDTSKTHKIDNSSNSKGAKRFRIKMKGGMPQREENTSLALYHLTVRQVTNDGIDWEKRFDDRLDAQKGQVALTQLEKQKAETAIYERKKNFEQGEANKVAEQKKLEKEQIQKTITAQTAAQVAEYGIIEQDNLLKAGKKAAELVRVTVDAQSYANRQLVSAGLTPQEKQEYANARVIGLAHEIKDLKLPGTVIIGSGGDKNSEGLLSTLIGAGLAKQMLPAAGE